MSENPVQELEVLRDRLGNLTRSVQDRANFFRDRTDIDKAVAQELDVVVEALDAIQEP